jgi:hypothetical protein
MNLLAVRMTNGCKWVQRWYALGNTTLLICCAITDNSTVLHNLASFCKLVSCPHELTESHGMVSGAILLLCHYFCQ